MSGILRLLGSLKQDALSSLIYAAIQGKLTYEDMMDEAKQKESLPEELTKIEKDLKVYLHEKEKMDKRTTHE